MDEAPKDQNADPQIEDDKKIRNKGLIPVFTSGRDNYPLNPCPYHEDGNPEMYTVENMEKRRALKKNELVVTAIKKFIRDQFQIVKDKCSKEEYFKVFMRIGMILRPGIEADDLQRIIRDDFEQDAADKQDLEKDKEFEQ